MVNNCDLVLWLNKDTLEERWLHKFYGLKDTTLWVKVPDGATFATGDKYNFVFRKDGWYYDEQKYEWVETNVLLKHFPEYKYIKLFWVKSEGNKLGIKNPCDKIAITLDRLLGCEVLFDDESFFVKYVYYTHQIGHLVLENKDRRAYVSTFDLLTFFTEDGDELTFDEYVAMYYGD